jgi:hypothetical protein
VAVKNGVGRSQMPWRGIILLPSPAEVAESGLSGPESRSEL